jgi:transcriptional accessory protein Tex/SPT6
MLRFVYRCELIALGNGTACRETEFYLSDLIQKDWFSPLDVKFTIVYEQGASVYSCSAIAQKEFPGTDPNMISAGNDSVFLIKFFKFQCFCYYYSCLCFICF